MSAPTRFLIGAGTTSLALALGAGPVLSSMPSALAKAKGPTVRICHGTSSASNPYIAEKPAADSKQLQGHESHVGPVYAVGMKEQHLVWGDIIPPFTVAGTTYPGLNWSTAGQAIWNNGCRLPNVPSPSPSGSPSPNVSPSAEPSGAPSDAPSPGVSDSPTASASPSGSAAVSPSPSTTSTPFTGGAGNVTITLTAPQPAGKGAGAGTVTLAKTLPFTGGDTGRLALEGLAILLNGLGFVLLGQKRVWQLSR